MGLHWQLEAGQQTGHEKWTDHQEVTRLVTVQYNNVAHRHGVEHRLQMAGLGCKTVLRTGYRL